MIRFLSYIYGALGIIGSLLIFRPTDEELKEIDLEYENSKKKNVQEHLIHES